MKNTTLDELEKKLSDSLSKICIAPSIVLNACEKMLFNLEEGTGPLIERLKSNYLNNHLGTENDFKVAIQELKNFLERNYLEKKLKRELAIEFSASEFQRLERIDFLASAFEAWRPLGVLFHITPSNAPLIPFLSLIEGLLTGNLNLVKLSKETHELTHTLCDALIAADVSGILGQAIFLFTFSSVDTKLTQELAKLSHLTIVWGGSNAITEVRKMLPPNTEIVEWGHKISFSYITKKFITSDFLSESIKKLATDCCLMEQQACSSPQIIYIEAESIEDEHFKFCVDEFKKSFRDISENNFPERSINLSIQDHSEITTKRLMGQYRKALGTGDAYFEPEEKWTLLIDNDSGLTPSPLFRTVWVKPLLKEKIVSTLWSHKNFLQTVGLLADLEEWPQISDLFFKAGSCRIRNAGEMLESYEGEPHDGRYALARYLKRVNIFNSKNIPSHIHQFSQLENLNASLERDIQVLSKNNFQKLDLAHNSELFFKSGGSSGKATVSTFTYDDYHQQMKLAAMGLKACGLDPQSDIVMNLFFGGGLYGGLISFFTILEFLRAKQLPMAAHPDHKMVGEAIVQFKVNTLLGMPSYIMQLFHQNHDLFVKNPVIKKIFYAGEHFTDKQKDYFQKTFGVSLIRSATYGSVDAGPLGYQCQFSSGGIHHLHQDSQTLEIFKIDSDEAVNGEEVGRLLFTSKIRQGQNIIRYEIGDMGRFILEPCPCGIKSPRFELLGRTGDIFRSAGTFFNYQKIEKIFCDVLSYSGEFQIEIYSSSQNLTCEKLKIVLAQENIVNGVNPESIKEILFEHYHDLREIVLDDKLLELEVALISQRDFIRASQSGKTKRIIDHRANS